MKNRRVYGALVVLLLAGIGCNLASEVEATLTETGIYPSSPTISVESADTPQIQSAQTPDFHSRVRIAKLDGTIIADITDIDLANIAGDPTAIWVVPSAWLDNETLLVEVRGDNWNKPALVALRFDRSGMNTLATGKFLGLLFP